MKNAVMKKLTWSKQCISLLTALSLVIQIDGNFVFSNSESNAKILPDFGTKWFDKPQPKIPNGPPVGKPFIPDKRSPYKVYDSEVALNAFNNEHTTQTFDVNAKTRSSEIEDPKLSQTINGDTYYGLNSPNDRHKFKEAAMNYDQTDTRVRTAKGLPLNSNVFPTLDHIEEETHVIEQPLQHTASISHSFNQNTDDQINVDEQAKTKHNVDEGVTVNEVQGPYEQNMDGADLRHDNDLTAKLIDHIKDSDKPPLGELEGMGESSHATTEHADETQVMGSNIPTEANHVEDSRIEHNTDETTSISSPDLMNEQHTSEQLEPNEPASKLVENIKDEDKPPVVHMSEEDLKSNPDKHLHDSPGIPELDAISSENEALHLGSHFGDLFPQEPDIEKEEHTSHTRHHTKTHKGHRYLPSHGGALAEILTAENEGQKHHSHGKKHVGNQHLTINTDTGEIMNEFKISSKAIKAEEPLTRSDATKAEKYNHPKSTRNSSSHEEMKPLSRQILHQPPINFAHGLSGIHRHEHESNHEEEEEDEEENHEHKTHHSNGEKENDESLKVLNHHKKTPSAVDYDHSVDFDPFPPNWEEQMMGNGEAESRHKTNHYPHGHHRSHLGEEKEHNRVMSEISDIIRNNEDEPDMTMRAMPEVEDFDEKEEQDTHPESPSIHHEEASPVHHEEASPVHHEENQHFHDDNHHRHHYNDEDSREHTEAHESEPEWHGNHHDDEHGFEENAHGNKERLGHMHHHQNKHYTHANHQDETRPHEHHTQLLGRGHTDHYNGDEVHGKHAVHEPHHQYNEHRSKYNKDDNSEEEDGVEELNVKNVHPKYASEKYDHDIDVAMASQHQHRHGPHHPLPLLHNTNHHLLRHPDTSDDHIHEDESFANNEFDNGDDDDDGDEENGKRKSDKASHKNKHRFPHEPKIVKQHELVEPSFMLHEDPHGDGLGNGFVAGLELGGGSSENKLNDAARKTSKDAEKRENDYTNTTSLNNQNKQRNFTEDQKDDSNENSKEKDGNNQMVAGKIKGRITNLPSKIIKNIGNSQDEVNVEIDSNVIQNMIKSSLLGLSKDKQNEANKHIDSNSETSMKENTSEVTTEHEDQHIYKQKHNTFKDDSPSSKDWNKAAEKQFLEEGVRNDEQKNTQSSSSSSSSSSSLHPSETLSENTEVMHSSKDVMGEQRHNNVDSQKNTDKNQYKEKQDESSIKDSDQVQEKSSPTNTKPLATQLLQKATATEEKLTKMDNDVTEQLNKASVSLAKATERQQLKDLHAPSDHDGTDKNTEFKFKSKENLQNNEVHYNGNRDNLMKSSSKSDKKDLADNTPVEKEVTLDEPLKPLVKNKLLSKIEEHLNGFEIEDLNAIHDQIKQLHAQKMLEKSQEEEDKEIKKSTDSSHLDLDVKSTKYDIPEHQLTLPITNPGHPDDSNGIPEKHTRSNPIHNTPLLNPAPTSQPIDKIEPNAVARESLSYRRQKLKTENALSKNFISKNPSLHSVKITGHETDLDLQPFVVASKTRALFLKNKYKDINGAVRATIARKNNKLQSKLKKYLIGLPTHKPDVGPINRLLYKNFTTDEKVDQVSDLGDTPDSSLEEHHNLQRRNVKRLSKLHHRTTITSRRSIISPIKSSTSISNKHYKMTSSFDDYNAKQFFIKELAENADKAKHRKRVLSMKRSLG